MLLRCCAAVLVARSGGVCATSTQGVAPQSGCCYWCAVGCLLLHGFVVRQQVLQVGQSELNLIGMCDASSLQHWSSEWQREVQATGYVFEHVGDGWCTSCWYLPLYRGKQSLSRALLVNRVVDLGRSVAIHQGLVNFCHPILVSSFE
jgi:hypothetical protein